MADHVPLNWNLLALPALPALPDDLAPLNWNLLAGPPVNLMFANAAVPMNWNLPALMFEDDPPIWLGNEMAVAPVPSYSASSSTTPPGAASSG